LLGAIQVEEESESESDDENPTVKDSTVLKYLMEEGLGRLRERAVQSMLQDIPKQVEEEAGEGGQLARQLSCLLDLPRTMTSYELEAFSDAMLEFGAEDEEPKEKKVVSIDSMLGADINEFVDDDGEEDEEEDEEVDQSDEGAAAEQQRRLEMKKTEVELMSLWERRKRETAAGSGNESEKGGESEGASGDKPTALSIGSEEYGEINVIERKLFAESNNLKPVSFYGLESDPNMSFRIEQMESEQTEKSAACAEKDLLYDEWAATTKFDYVEWLQKRLEKKARREAKRKAKAKAAREAVPVWVRIRVGEARCQCG
jgi:hypothetical protein